MATNLEKLKTILRAAGIKPTYQRLRILKYLKENKTHPSADMIYKALVGEIPIISKTTVYNTLDILLKKGLVIPVIVSGTETRFDSNTSWHSHFLCEECGRVIDLDIKCEYLEKKEVEGHRIKQIQSYLKGVCRNCLKKMERKESAGKDF
jgi:Fur family peroxide stress response transcriptional regulator